MKKLLLIAGVVLCFIASCTYKKGDVPPPAFKCDSTVHYHATVDSIIIKNCSTQQGCHVSGGPGTGDFTIFSELQTRALNGRLLEKVVTLKTMPQGFALSQADIDRIHCWIDQGGLNN